MKERVRCEGEVARVGTVVDESSNKADEDGAPHAHDGATGGDGDETTQERVAGVAAATGRRRGIAALSGGESGHGAVGCGLGFGQIR